MERDQIQEVTQCVEQKQQQGREELRIKQYQKSNQVKNDDFDEVKFQKQLNMSVKMADGDLLVEIKNPDCYQQVKQSCINDKNIINVTQQQSQSIQLENNPKPQQRQNQNIQQRTQSTKIAQNSNKIEQPLDNQNTLIRDITQNKEKKNSNNQHNRLVKNHNQNSLQQQTNQLKVYNPQPQRIAYFNPEASSKTIKFNQQLNQADQSKFYYQNYKIALTHPINSQISQITFRLDNIKYCVGVGVGLKEILEKHDYDYKSTTSSQLGHGLYIVTTQGYSWSHSEQQDDDTFRENFNTLYSGVNINAKLEGQNLTLKWKKGEFSMKVPSRIKQKYTLCFCAYLHQKTDSVSIFN